MEVSTNLREIDTMKMSSLKQDLVVQHQIHTRIEENQSQGFWSVGRKKHVAESLLPYKRVQCPGFEWVPQVCDALRT